MLVALALSVLIPTQTAGAVVDLSDDSPVLTRLIVRDLSSDVLDPRELEVLGEALSVELRKLRGLDVISMSDLRTLLEIEVEKQVVGCDDDGSCLAELADTMGADGWLTGTVARVGGERVISVARFDAKRALVTHRAQLRIAGDDAVALLESVDAVVEELFPEMKLREGAKRGVAPVLRVKMSPPPIPEWLTWTSVAATGAAAVSAAVLGVLAQQAYARSEALLASSTAPDAVIPASEIRAQYDDSVNLALGAQIAAATAAGLAVTTALLFPFTHFEEDTR